MTEDSTAARVTPTLEMVAAVAGVSRSTVSRVVNASPRVTPDALKAVTAAIDQLGYVPNRAARSLASRRTFTIALVIPENTAKFFADPYFASVVQGVAMYLSGTDYTLTLIIASEAEPEKTRRYLQGGNVDGALILSHHRDDRSYVQLARSLPVVFGGRPMSQEGEENFIVDVDNVAASTVATRYLLDHGRRRLATIAGPQNMAAGIDRVEGWRAALAEAGLHSDLLEEGDFTPEGGAAAMERLLARGEPFDGVFIASAQMASGALGALRSHGLSVPADVAITSMDNDYFAKNATPPLTTIDQPAGVQGTKIAEVLVRLINGEEVEKLTLIPTELVERDSV
ncbi:LacI family transcriptional regulator [Glaciihabitans tibetensis]|uniref:LacI family transcriptional regulator n=1 Tax=Glaciihabitans tibetensis TaxID=1266600 RepID=A0A2T0V9T4_9MICO|nr:LacI family DNA-binding transcriptional regulator [Glaciihabitans tibetensis]PRY66946.1 LacI family transcriptional regulator [Glaciihabitans tibetensis]